MHLAMIIAAWTLASPIDGAWTDATTFFEQGKTNLANRSQAIPLFRKAAEMFADAEAAGLKHPALYRNLGNAWYLADNLPEAILAYRQGLALDPSNAELRDALELARSQVVRVDDNHGLAETLPSTSMSPSGWLALFATLWAMACVVALRAWHRRSVRLALIATTLTALALVGAGAWKHVRDGADVADLVVLNDDGVALRRGNGEHYPPNPELPVLRRGMEARRVHERGAWLQIRFGSGEVGWVPREAVVTSKTAETQRRREIRRA